MAKAKYKMLKIDGRDIKRSRYVIEQHLGRKLTEDEAVHHKNKNILDDRIENLQLMTRSEHQRLHINEWYETHNHPMLGKKQSNKTKNLISEGCKDWHKKHIHPMLGKTGSKSLKWVEGDVCPSTIGSRRYRAWNRIIEGRGKLDDFLYLKETGGII